MTTELSISILSVGLFVAGAVALMAGALLISLVLDRLCAANGAAGVSGGVASMFFFGGLAGYLRRDFDFAFLGAVSGLALAYAGAMLFRKFRRADPVTVGESKGQKP